MLFCLAYNKLFLTVVNYKTYGIFIAFYPKIIFSCLF